MTHTDAEHDGATDDDHAAAVGHAIVAGFGLPGRTVADRLKAAGVPYHVIELNPATVDRCGHAGVPIIEGDVTSEDCLRRAGVAAASLVVLAVPNEATVLAAVSIVRRLNPTCRLIARCTFTSGGFEALRRGANQIVVAEQCVAREMSIQLHPELELHGFDPHAEPAGRAVAAAGANSR